MTPIQAHTLATTALTPTGPDAELLSAIERFRSMMDDRHAEYVALNRMPKRHPDYKRRWDAWLATTPTSDKLEKWIALAVPQTLAGAQSKAALGYAMLAGDDPQADDLLRSDTGACRMWAVALAGTRDMVRLTGGGYGEAWEHPDADLIAACAGFGASEAAYSAIHDDTECSLSDEERAALADPISDGWTAMLDRMEALHATTNDGLAARALALAQHSGIKPGTKNYAFDFSPNSSTVTGRLLHLLMRDAVNLGGRA